MKTIVPIKKGHLVIPVTEDNYKLVDTISITIDKRDVDELYNLLDKKKFLNLSNEIKNEMFVLWLTTEFPDLIYKKIKENFPKEFDDGGLFRIDMIEFWEGKIEVHLDYLKDVLHPTIKEEK